MSDFRDSAPQQPLSWTQRAGIACLFVGAAIVIAYIAGRLGLVRSEQMIAALVEAVEKPAQGVRIVEVPEIRAAAGI